MSARATRAACVAVVVVIVLLVLLVFVALLVLLALLLALPRLENELRRQVSYVTSLATFLAQNRWENIK